MGLLKVGKPLEWEDSLPYLNYVREHGVLQFLEIYKKLKDTHRTELKWGEELEYGIIMVDHEAKTVRLSLRGGEIMAELNQKEHEFADRFEGCTWQPEFGSWMVESTPNRPYTGYANDLTRVEPNMRLRRKRLLSVLRPNEVAPSLTAFPLMGVGIFTEPPHPSGGAISLSDYVPDACINPHPRFAALVRNIRSRRGRKVDIRVPLYRDRNTPEYQGEGVGDGEEESSKTSQPMVHMDAMAFGMGCCCLQVTLQARDIGESRYMYDQFAVLAPILLALTAATPILKGRLVDTDVRWDTIAGSVDDRRPAELGELEGEALAAAADPRMAGSGVQRLYKSRYDAISCYIYACPGMSTASTGLNVFNDKPVEVDEKVEQQLLDNGIDPALARHLAHLFVRDPLVIFDGSIDVDDSKTTEHFENIQSTNWQTVRWKPPPPRHHPDDPHIGWRTEFRSMEIQLTDFENAAFTVFIILLTRIILAFDLHLYIPISKVDENMARAHKRNGVLTQKFWFRKYLAAGDVVDEEVPAICKCMVGTEVEEMTIAEILNGKSTYFPGLLPMCYAYLEYIRCDRETSRVVGKYLEFIRKRSTGEVLTTASWIRKFVTQHPDYKEDSVVSPSVAYDLVCEAKAVGEGAKPCRDLLGDVVIDPIVSEEAYDVHLTGAKLGGSATTQIIEHYVRRASLLRKQRSSSNTPHPDFDDFDAATYAASK